jgi:hypothetical protein
MNIRDKMPVSSLSKTACLALCGIALLLQGCEINLGLQGIKGSGVPTTKAFEVDTFDQVRFSGSGEFNIKCGEEQSMTVSFDDNLMEFVEVTVENGKLKLDVTESYSSGTGLKVDITVPELKLVELSGAGKANITNFSGEKLSVDISGAATIIAEGTAETVDVEASGACTLKLLDLEAKNGNFDMTGAGSAKVHVTEKLDAKISGVGSVKYKGDPEVNEDISGVGSVSKIE